MRVKFQYFPSKLKDATLTTITIIIVFVAAAMIVTINPRECPNASSLNHPLLDYVERKRNSRCPLIWTTILIKTEYRIMEKQ